MKYKEILAEAEIEDIEAEAEAEDISPAFWEDSSESRLVAKNLDDNSNDQLTVELVEGCEAALRTVPPREYLLPCTLEELCNGAEKKVKISRSVIDANGLKTFEEESLTTDIIPGLGKGDGIVVPEKGDKEANVIPGDIIFVVDEEPHPIYAREGNDLVVHQEISMVDAVKGTTIELVSLDGRYLRIAVKNIQLYGCDFLVQNEGMPIIGKRGKKGKLRLKFTIKAP